MPLLVGEPIPEPYFTHILDPHVAYYHYRGCNNCGHVWVGAEIPLRLAPHLKLQALACLCPNHLLPAASNGSFSMDNLVQRTYVNKSHLLVASFGGMYRRRWCRYCLNPECGHSFSQHYPAPEKPCHVKDCTCARFRLCINRRGMKMAWATGEFAATGLVCKDITRCAKCGAKGYERGGRSTAALTGRRARSSKRLVLTGEAGQLHQLARRFQEEVHPSVLALARFRRRLERLLALPDGLLTDDEEISENPSEPPMVEDLEKE